jgi:prophage regulatory protein
MHELTTFLRLPSVKARVGLGRESVYHGVRQGTFPPPVKIGARASAWLEHEVEALNRARLAGRSDDEIRELVAQLVAAREECYRSIDADQAPDRATLPRRTDGKFCSACQPTAKGANAK